MLSPLGSRETIPAIAALLLSLALLPSAFAQPDLVISAIGVDFDDPVVYPRFTQLRVQYTVTNLGEEATSFVTTGFYLSDDFAFSPDDIFVDDATSFSVPAGGSRTRTALMHAPIVDAGMYALIGFVDYEDEYVESDETNNLNFTGVQVGGIGPGVVNIDFDFEAPTYSGQGVHPDPGNGFWNSRVSQAGNPWTVMDLIQSDGMTPSNVVVSFPGGGRGRSSAPNDLLEDYAFGSTTNGPVELRFDGLFTDATYDLYLYAGDSIAGTAFSFGGNVKETSAGDQSTFLENVNYVVFRDLVPNAGGTISGTMDNSSTDGTTGQFILNGLQVVAYLSVADGDMNCDGLLSVADIGPFVLALTSPGDYPTQFPDCDLNNADLNQDGEVSVGDIGLFVALLTGA